MLPIELGNRLRALFFNRVLLTGVILVVATDTLHTFKNRHPHDTLFCRFEEYYPRKQRSHRQSPVSATCPVIAGAWLFSSASPRRKDPCHESTSHVVLYYCTLVTFSVQRHLSSTTPQREILPLPGVLGQPAKLLWTAKSAAGEVQPAKTEE